MDARRQSFVLVNIYLSYENLSKFKEPSSWSQSSHFFRENAEADSKVQLKVQ